MHSFFNTILVPVDFSVNTDVAIHKAIQLGLPDHTEIHLLHIQSADAEIAPSKAHAKHVSPHFPATDAYTKLQQWKWSIEDRLPEIKVYVWITENGGIQEMIEKKAIDIQADLIIIGQHAVRGWFSWKENMNPVNITRNTGIPVLTAKPGALHQKIKTVVIPVTGQTTKAKLNTIAALSKKFHFRIHLVSVLNDQKKTGVYPAALLSLFRWLKDNLRCPVEYSVLHAGNRPRAILDYAMRIDADLLLMHTPAETKLGWPNRFIGDMVPATSKMQLLLLDPENTQLK